MVERLCRTDWAVCDSVLQGAESDLGSGGPSPSAGRPGDDVSEGLWVDGRRGHESLDRVLRPVLQPPSGGGKAFMGLSVRQDDSECKVVQARAVGGSGPGPHGTGVFGKDHIPVAVVAIVHAPMPRLVRSRSSGEAVSASREVMIEVVSMEVGDV